MKLLLDTHAFLWFVAGNTRLGRKARRLMEEEASELFLSAVSVWEMAIKSSLKRLHLSEPLDEYLIEKMQGGFQMLSVDWSHAAAVERMPFHHRDPFDRLLIAQAIAEGMTLVSGDPAFRPYPVKVVW